MSLDQSQAMLSAIASRCKMELAIRLLTPRHCADRPPFLSKALRPGETSARARMRQANLLGIGIGIKETYGRLTDVPAIRVYVTQKVPQSDLPNGCRVPEVVNGMATDVIPVCELRFHGRPATLGQAISHVRGLTGSIGCLVTRDGADDEDDWFLLSASHVLAPAGASPGDDIVEPPASERGTRIATLTDFEPLKAGGFANQFDAAIARVINRKDVEPSIPIIGLPQPEIAAARLNQRVRKYGAGSSETRGLVTCIDAEITFTFLRRDYLFAGMIEVKGNGEYFSKDADSGALVVDASTSQPVGLIIGGADDLTYTSPIDRILHRFGARIVTQP